METRIDAGSALRAATVPGEMLALEPRYLFDAAAATTADVTTDTGTGDTSTASNDTSAGPADYSQQQTTAFIDSITPPAAVGGLIPDGQEFGTNENSRPGLVVGDIEASPDVTFTLLADGSTSTTAFAVDSDTGLITVSNPSELDFETTPAFTLHIGVTDSDGNADEANVTVNLFDINERPTVESPGDQSVVGDSNTTLEIQLDANDPDGNDIAYALIDTTEGTVPEGASIDQNGLITWTPGESQRGDTVITVRVSDPDALSLSSTTQFTVTVTEPTGDLIPDGQEFGTNENSRPGLVVGDIEASPDVTFALLADGSTSTTAFAVDSDTGMITVSNPSELDFETTPAFTLRIGVTDSDGNTDETNVTVNLFDINERPTVESPGDQSVVGDSNTTLEIQLDANDPDGDDIAYALIDTTEGTVPEGASIDQNGLITWTPAESQRGDTVITVRVSDPGALSLSSTTQFTVTVTEPAPEPEPEPEPEAPPFTPINDSNNSNPVSISGATSTSASGADFITDSPGSGRYDPEAEIIRDSVQSSESRDSSPFDPYSTGETDEGGSEYLASSEVAAIDADIAEMQRLIDAGKDPTLLTPATAAGISKQLMQEASTPEAQATEILNILENVTNLIGCGR